MEIKKKNNFYISKFYSEQEISFLMEFCSTYLFLFIVETNWLLDNVHTSHSSWYMCNMLLLLPKSLLLRNGRIQKRLTIRFLFFFLKCNAVAHEANTKLRDIKGTDFMIDLDIKSKRIRKINFAQKNVNSSDIWCWKNK